MCTFPFQGCCEQGNPFGRSEDKLVANEITVASILLLQQSRLRSIHENLGKAHGREQLENCQAVTCQIRYTLNLDKLSAFETYARIWISLIERYSGIHHGYFLPRAAPNGVGMSFPGLGYDGPADVAVAMFTFPNEESYRGTARRSKPNQSANRPQPSSGRQIALSVMSACSSSQCGASDGMSGAAAHRARQTGSDSRIRDGATLEKLKRGGLHITNPWFDE